MAVLGRERSDGGETMREGRQRLWDRRGSGSSRRSGHLRDNRGGRRSSGDIGVFGGER